MPKRPITAQDLLRMQFVGDPQMHPDGARVLFQKKHIGEKNVYIANLFTVDADGTVRQWTQGDGGAGHGRWSPDGAQIAFISGREKEHKAQLWVMPTSGGEARRLTQLPEGAIGGFKWSPDGRYLAFTFRETHPDWTEAARKEREAKGLSTPPRMIDDVWYRLDGDGYFLGQRFALYLAEVATGEHRKLYEGCPLGMYSYDWSPDSKELAVAHTVNKNPLLEPANDQIWRVDLQGQAWKLEGLPKGDKGALRWSPDGKWLAYVGNVDEDDPWGVRNDRLWLVSAEGGEATCITADDDYCLTASTLSDSKEFSADATVEWSPDSQAIYVALAWNGESQIGFVQLDQPGRAKPLTEGRQSITVGTLSRSGEQIACVTGTATKPNEVAIYDLSQHSAEPQVLTAFNAEWLSEVEVVEPEELQGIRFLFREKPGGG